MGTAPRWLRSAPVRGSGRSAPPASSARDPSIRGPRSPPPWTIPRWPNGSRHSSAWLPERSEAMGRTFAHRPRQPCLRLTEDRETLDPRRSSFRVYLMSVPQKHKEHAPASVKCGVITVSDSRTPETDESGKLVRDLLLRSGHTVLFHAIVKDEAKQIVDAVEQASWTCDAIITNGGTGLAPRDVTIAALVPLFQKTLPGFGELFRSLSYPEIGSSAMMSGAIAGVYHGRLVFCLPGSPDACRLALEALIPLEEAMRIAMDLVRPIERKETVPILDALRRVSAEDVRSPIDVPLADRAAMDGYAVLARDTFRAGKFKPVTLRRIETLYADGVPRKRVASGGCTEVATGSTLPKGADAGGMVQATERERGIVKVYSPLHPGEHLSRHGAAIAPN